MTLWIYLAVVFGFCGAVFLIGLTIIALLKIADWVFNERI